MVQEMMLHQNIVSESDEQKAAIQDGHFAVVELLIIRMERD